MNPIVPPPDPFPGTPLVDISGFTYLEPLVTTRAVAQPAPGVEWIVFRDYTVALTVNGVATTLTVPANAGTDFSSVPPILQSILPKIGAHAEASVIHDWLYEAWKYHRPAPRRQDQLFADRVLLAAMAAAGVDRTTRDLAYYACREFGWALFST